MKRLFWRYDPASGSMQLVERDGANASKIIRQVEAFRIDAAGELDSPSSLLKVAWLDPPQLKINTGTPAASWTPLFIHTEAKGAILQASITARNGADIIRCIKFRKAGTTRETPLVAELCTSSNGNNTRTSRGEFVVETGGGYIEYRVDGLVGLLNASVALRGYLS